jgi:acetolactate synthase-1/2/3 large subunit
MELRNGAERIAVRLASAGVTHIFGYPGESSLPLYEAVRRTSGLTHVMARCERCAGFMADGYARATNRVGVCDAPGGVGTPWLVPALHEAYTSAVPLVALTTSSPDQAVGRWPTTHCDNAALFSSVTKAVLPLRVQDRIEEIIDRAITLSCAGRPGPVVVDIEPLLLLSLGRAVDGRSSPGRAYYPHQRPRADREAVARVASALAAAARPLMVLGGGVHTSRAYEWISAFNEAVAIPVVTTFNGKGALPEGRTPWVGVIGAKGQPEANEAANEADLVLWLGSKAGDKSTQYGMLPSEGAMTVQVDVDPEAGGRTFAADIVLCADLGAFLDDLRVVLAEMAPGWKAPAWVRCTSAAAPDGWGGASAVTALRSAVGHPARLIADASKASSWVGAFDRTPGGGRWVWGPRGSGTLGYALPAAVGAAAAVEGEPVVVVCGDGGLSMSAHELDSAVAGGGPIAVVLLNNGALGLLEDVGRHTLAEGFSLPGRPQADWVALARSYGAQAVRVSDTDELALRLKKWRERGGVLLVEAVLPGGEISPDLAMFLAQGGRSW